jgi:hypothetical protein
MDIIIWGIVGSAILEGWNVLFGKGKKKEDRDKLFILIFFFFVILKLLM